MADRMPRQRVSEEELTKLCDLIEMMEGAGVGFIDGEICLANMLALDLKDMRDAWIAEPSDV